MNILSPSFDDDLVGSSGLEPPTSCLSGTRSNLLSYEPVDFLTQPAPLGLRSSISSPLVAFATGGDEGNRTLDPLLAGQVLSQLSYTPILLGLKSLKIEQQLLLLFVFLFAEYEHISIRSLSP